MALDIEGAIVDNDGGSYTSKLNAAKKEVHIAVGRMRGLMRAAKLTPERRAEIARQGGLAAAKNRKLRLEKESLSSLGANNTEKKEEDKAG